MNWLEDALRHYTQARDQLGDEPDPLQGLRYPNGVGEPAGGSIPSQDDALHLLIQGYQKYLKRSGRNTDPLLQQRGVGGDGPRGLVSRTQGELVPGADGEQFRVTSHGPRKGMVHQRYTLGDGLFANVYYDPRTGRRQVVRFKGRSAPSKGVAR